MTDILGPGSTIDAATTTRPADARVMTALDTWFADCSGPGADDGTPITADFLNGYLGLLRAAVRGNGTLLSGGLVVPEDDTDGMLLNAFLQMVQRGKMLRATDSGSVNALIASMTPAPLELLDGMAIAILPAATNTGASTLNLIGTNPIVTQQGTVLLGGEIQAGIWSGMRWNAGASTWRMTDSPAPIKIKLRGNLTLYVRTDGDDSHNGLVNTAGGAFKTIQGCWNAIFALYDLSGFSITIQLGIAGTYDGAIFGQYTGLITINGIQTSPGVYSTTVKCPGTNNYVIYSALAGLHINLCKLDYTFTGSPSGVEGTVINVQGATTVIGNCIYNCSNNRPNLHENHSQQNSNINFLSGSTISVQGGGTRGIFAYTSAGGVIGGTTGNGSTTFSSVGTIPYNIAFAKATKNSSQDWFQALFGGFTATGKRYEIDLLSLINTSGGGANFLPGSVAGTPATVDLTTLAVYT